MPKPSLQPPAIPSSYKGGTALLLGYGLPRFSSDFDFDGRRAATDLIGAIETSVRAAGLSSMSVAVRKDTPTTKRYVLQYAGSLAIPHNA
ncbi:MAG: nucleotidyl transferase AbiEii/AbiGii toxin family protein [Thermomicrobiales bacterium]